MVSKSTYFIASCILLIVLPPHCLKSQSIGYEIRGDRNRVELPFDYLNKLVVIPVSINGLLPSKFILDSGVALTILTEKEICNLLGIPCGRQVQIPVIGTMDSVVACIAKDVTLKFPGINGTPQPVVVLEEDYLNLRSFLGDNVQGIIGYDLFRNFVVKVNYSYKTVTLIRPEEFKPPRNYERIPMELINNRPYVKCQIVNDAGVIVPVNLIIDLGASHALMFEIDPAGPIQAPPNSVESLVGRGLGGDILGYLGRIKEFRIGSFFLSDVIVSFADSYDKNEQAPTYRHGALGSDILSRFHVIIDYPDETIYLKQNLTFNTPFEYNLSGMDVMAMGLMLNEFIINQVKQESPADKAGILPGDKILIINGQYAADLTLNEINHILHSRPGRRVWLKLEREGQILRRSFVLVRLI
jgi:hypothetical protein